jgi:hypothetical protein
LVSVFVTPFICASVYISVLKCAPVCMCACMNSHHLVSVCVHVCTCRCLVTWTWVLVAHIYLCSGMYVSTH